MSSTVSTVFTIIYAACCITCLAGFFLMFRDMGRSGWLSLIPFYNTYVLFDEVYGNGWKFLLLLIPIYNIYLLIKLLIDWVRKFGATLGFRMYLIPLLVILVASFLLPVFMALSMR